MIGSTMFTILIGDVSIVRIGHMSIGQGFRSEFYSPVPICQGKYSPEPGHSDLHCVGDLLTYIFLAS